MAVELVDPRRALEVVPRNLSLPCRDNYSMRMGQPRPDGVRRKSMRRMMRKFVLMPPLLVVVSTRLLTIGHTAPGRSSP